MFCLRSWLPLLFIPTSASPAFIVLFFISTYFLHRPCIYCSVLLFILFLSSCHWSDHCFFDVHSNWFEPRHVSSSSSVASTAGFAANVSTAALSGMAAAQAAAEKVGLGTGSEWTGLGLQWIRRLFGRRVWRLPCLDVLVRL